MGQPDRIHLGICGAAGRMGRSMLENLHHFELLELRALVEREDHHQMGEPILGVSLSDDLLQAAQISDVLIDFSSPAACLRAAEAAAQHGCALISGTTGLSPEQLEQLHSYQDKIALLHAANFSVGVNLLAELVEQACRGAGPQFDVEIFEAHHHHKVDAPSGTALHLGKAAARGLGASSLDEVADWARHGNTGARKEGHIGFSVLRGGDIVGEHTVFLCGLGERLELTHRATDRGIFARGALRAAQWIAGKPAGNYSMRDVLFS